MKIEKTQLKKAAKFFTLLLTAIFIATASAAVYFELALESQVTTQLAAVRFVSGDDSTEAGVSISGDGTWASLGGLKAYPNVTLTYEQAVNISNTDTSSHDVRLRSVSITPASGLDVANFTSISFKICDVSGTTLETLTYTVTGAGASAAWSSPSPTGFQSLPQNTEWSIYVEIEAEPGASENVIISVDMRLDVQ